MCSCVLFFSKRLLHKLLFVSNQNEPCNACSFRSNSPFPRPQTAVLIDPHKIIWAIWMVEKSHGQKARETLLNLQEMGKGVGERRVPLSQNTVFSQLMDTFIVSFPPLVLVGDVEPLSLSLQPGLGRLHVILSDRDGVIL